MVQKQLRQAFALMKQGDKRQATQIVQDVIKQDRNNVPAWWLMANILDDETRKRKALDKVLSLDANHAGAKKMLASLDGTPLPASVKKTPPPGSSLDGRSTIEIEFDWTRLEEREARKVKPKSESSDHHAIRIASIAMTAVVIVIIIASIFLIVIPSIRNSQSASQIEDTMTSFLEAIVTGEIANAETFVCEQNYRNRGRADSFTSGVNIIYRQHHPNFSNMKIKVSDFTDDSAVAELSGNVRMIPTQGQAMTVPIADIMGAEAFNYGTTSFEFILENEQWRICASAFGE